MMYTLPAAAQAPTYAADLQFLRKYTPVVELKLGSERLAVAPAWQGRVMTSAIAPDQPDFGWMNKAFIAGKKLVPHMNVFGGEDRFWLGPEGGQYGLFFPKGANSIWPTGRLRRLSIPFRTECLRRRRPPSPFGKRPPWLTHPAPASMWT